MSKVRVLVIGNGMVGHHFLEQLAKKRVTDTMDITVIGAEPRAAYDRVHLSEYFSGKSADDLAMGSLDDYRDWGFTAVVGETITQIDRQEKVVHGASGKTWAYDKLILATGSYPFVPPIPGKEAEGCLVYRTIEDLDDIQKYANDSEVGVVVGGGLLGLEAANALRQLGLESHVVEFAPSLMPAQLDLEGGKMLRRKIEEIGVSVHTEKATQQIVAGDKHRLKMCFADGSELETDMIVFSAGIRPSDSLARECELVIGERGGIVIDSQCLTSDKDIYAIGECALYDNKIFGLVAPGYSMARVAMDHLLGGDSRFEGADMSTKLKLLGVDVGSIGDSHGRTPESANYQFIDGPEGVYCRMNVTADGKKLLGAVLVGDCSAYDTLLQYYQNDLPLPASPEALLLPASGEPVGLGPAQLPDTASICSCHNVCKGDIVSAIDGGCCTLGDIKDATKASTGCGGCAALLKNVVDNELAARGVEVSKAICEHFEYSREELYTIAQVSGIKTFESLISQHGKGQGCDICKPAAASIFASLWNDYILEEDHVPLQDTNDTFLANMQKNGTYSVVPRVAGGEIKPEHLILIGQIAQKYDLYTKITGGQRIDLFGARLEQLPKIWKELVDAGMETGHAYGKSVRTVKSCVGSTWCRYGVQDSVSMAIAIENRYKGLRSPHKLKFAVSGCTRECAEAQSKDVGVIATENGWNLYVCGNGGMKPRHADLFATDLDDEALIRTIDRFLMFYVKTADRLQRTSVWLDNLDGGLDYLKEVILDDSLGLGEALDAQMTRIVGTYQCEWKTTLENPEKLKRFRPFINSDSPDENVVFVRERDQIRPAREDEMQTIDAVEVS